MVRGISLDSFQENGSNYFLSHVAVFLVGCTVTFLVLYLSVIRNFTQKRQVTLVERLAVSPDLLNNPIVYEWRGSIVGKAISKDDHAFTLEDDNGNKLQITDIQPNGHHPMCSNPGIATGTMNTPRVLPGGEVSFTFEGGTRFLRENGFLKHRS